ncbi:MAG: AAA family ATPase [Brevinematales bacterium]|jgi:adenylate kinase family enzyme
MIKLKHIHIFGASGSGTTTLGIAISVETRIPLFDIDEYFWEETDPPFLEKRTCEERIRLMRQDLSKNNSWIISGSMMDWGDLFLPELDLAVYLHMPQETRIERLIKREKERFGSRIDPGNDMHQSHIDFMDWAGKYDNGGMEVRSKFKHSEWMKKLSCKIIKIEQDIELKDKLDIVLKDIQS